MRSWIFIIMMWGVLVNDTQSQVGVNVDKDTIAIGDIFTLTYDFSNIDRAHVANIDFSTLTEVENLLYSTDTMMLEKVSKIEIVGSNELGLENQNLNISPDNLNEKNNYEVRASIYDVGVYNIPTPTVNYNGATPVAPTPPRKLLFVLPPKGMTDMDNIDIQPIKDIIREPTHWIDSLVEYLYFHLTVALIGGLIYLLVRGIRRLYNSKVDEPLVIEEVKEPAEVIALRELKKLESESLWQNNQEKEYHSRLTKIIKHYLEDRYDMPALESTTSQIVLELKKHNLSKSLLDNVEKILNISDIVKFAKGEAGPQINEEFMKLSYDFVDKTKEAI